MEVSTSRYRRCVVTFRAAMMTIFALLMTCLVMAVPAAGADDRGKDLTSEIHERVTAAGSGARNAATPAVSQLQSLYAERDYRAIWGDGAEAQEQEGLARDILAHADREGLEPRDYLGGLAPPPERLSARDMAAHDVSLTLALITYARDVSKGRLPPAAAYSDIALPESTFDPVAGLIAAIAGRRITGYLAGLPPPHAQYRALVTALMTYRTISAQGGWPEIPGTDEIKIERGGDRVLLLARRLAAEDSEFAVKLAPSAGDITAAVKRYQTRNGLEPDGRIGKQTLEMLNISVSERIDQIIANMERWRWMPRIFERRYIAVNAAGMDLRFVENGNDILTSRVIVGRPQSPTPIFRAQANAVTANPPWNVPPKIAAREILPKLKQNPNYLASQDMILANGPSSDPHGASVDWRSWTAANFPYRIRQLPGQKNALGALKLELPNAFNVYLHDTPGKSAFERPDRALSHGCIRVQQIAPLAAAALGGDRQESSRILTGAIASAATRQIALADPLPVYVLYWTAIADADGAVGFRRDLYGRDKQLIAALMQRDRGPRVALSASDCEIAPG